ncbi:MAG: EAL domain-containing protein [Betaproteobacteria bacterium]|nr:EAL domain-containing protein [Betaproteobacteria bacterium]
MNFSTLNVLIVEDDDFQRRIMADILGSLGMPTVVQASNGKQALEIIHSRSSDPIHVALCDLNMPEMDGMEFLRHLGEEKQNVAVILTSALSGKLLSSVGRMTRLYGIRLLGTIEKPVLLSNLETLLLKYDAQPASNGMPKGKVFALEEILEAIEANQFEPFYQPKLDLRTKRLVGAEALARWIHPDHGVIEPGAFIPLLEKTKNIDGLTLRILRKAALACRSFHEKGSVLVVSVNLSLASLDDTSLADRVTEIVKSAGIDPQYIRLEITESAAMTNVAPALENLARLYMNGFSLSIDDYGTGSSNLQQLTRIPFSELKIDQSFVKDFSENAALKIVVNSSIDMARKLNVESVAEGVETLQDWTSLKEAGCDTVQGYFIARPMSEMDFFDFVRTHRPEIFAIDVPQLQVKKRTRILIVDDDNFTRMIVLSVLRDLGYAEIYDAESAEAAIRKFESDSFDLVITDINMPGMHGLKFIQMIRSGKTRADPGTRIMVLTLFSQTEILGASLALDVNGFLLKPIVPATAEERLAKALSEQFKLRSSIAYETVKTEPKALEKAPRNTGIGGTVMKSSREENTDSVSHTVPLHRLKPGMVLAESVHLKDGTLILSAEHALTEVSINRLNDLMEILPTLSVSIH